jgi:N-acetylglucosamine-6-sulfatase
MTSTPISRRSLIASTTSAAASIAAPQPARDRRPNVVFVIADDLRHDGLGCTGHPFARTPNIDRLSTEGVTFNNFFTAVPLCSPSRASFLTGLYPHTHRIINNDKQGLAEISHTLVSFPRLLRESGYETAFIGKWHMGFDDTRRPGFDHWISFRAQGLYIDPVVNVDDTRRQLRGYMTDFLNESAVAFLKRPRQRPFVLFLAHKAVHYPYLPARRHDDLYASATYLPPTVPPGDREGKPAMRRRHEKPVDMLRLEDSVPEPQESRRGRPVTPDAIVRDQARCMASVDEGMGMILETLARTGELDNTLVVFTADNGFLMGEHGQFDQKRWAYEESIRIPFVARYPKLIQPRTRRDQMAVSVDFAPTALELAGVKWGGPLHGRSLVPALRNADVSLHTSFLTEYYTEKFSPMPNWRAVRTNRWKYIQYPGFETFDELYDLENDRREVHNLAGNPEFREPLQTMRSELMNLLRQTGTSIAPHDVRVTP